MTDFDDVKICDFGLSKLRGEIFDGPNSLKIGTPYYTAPEQENDPDNVDFNADLYAVGVMFYRMVTGRLPEIKYKKASAVNLDLSDEFDDFLSTALSPNPLERYASADDMMADLQRLKIVWLDNKTKICAIPEDFFDEAKTNIRKTAIRAIPKKNQQTGCPKFFFTDRINDA